MAVTIERVGNFVEEVGESPFWHPGEQALYWIEGWNGFIRKMDPGDGRIESLQLDGRIGSIAARRGGGLVVAMHEREVLLLEPGSNSIAWRASCPADSQVMLNDGKVDQSGRFYFGGRDDLNERTVGSIYCLDPELNVRVLAANQVITFNGPCWSPDNSIFYCADSTHQVIYKFDVDAATGALSNRRVFASFEELGGLPDGATVDAQGNVWTALCQNGKIVCLSPTGKLERIIEMPSPMVCSVTFGGSELDILYVTSIGLKIPGHEHPENGGLFVVEGLGVRGLPEPCFGG